MKTKPITQPINPNEPHRYVGKNGVRILRITEQNHDKWPHYLVYTNGESASIDIMGKSMLISDYDLLEIVEDAPKTIPINMDWLLSSLSCAYFDCATWHDFDAKAKSIVIEAFQKPADDQKVEKPKDHPLIFKNPLIDHPFWDTGKPLTENVDAAPNSIPTVDGRLQEIIARMAAHMNNNYNPDFSAKGAEIGTKLRIKYPADYMSAKDEDIPEMTITLEEYTERFISPSKMVKDAKLKQSVRRLYCMAERLEYDDFYFTDDFEKEAEAILREVSNG